MLQDYNQIHVASPVSASDASLVHPLEQVVNETVNQLFGLNLRAR